MNNIIDIFKNNDYLQLLKNNTEKLSQNRRKKYNQVSL